MNKSIEISDIDFSLWCSSHWVLYATTNSNGLCLRFYVNMKQYFKITLGEQLIYSGDSFAQAKAVWNENSIIKDRNYIRIAGDK